MAPHLRLLTLGQLRLFAQDAELLPRRRKELALLTYLAAQSPRPVRCEKLQTFLWGERDEERASNSLRQALLRIRRAVGEVLEAGPHEVRLLPGTVTLDAAEFEQAAVTSDPCSAAGLWTGEFFTDADEIGGEGVTGWVIAERARLHNLLANCFERCVQDAESRGAWQVMVARAEQWAAVFPDDETAHRRLVEALQLSGRDTEARARYAAFTERLKGEMDAEPSPEWKRVGRALAAQNGSAKSKPANGVFAQLSEAWRARAPGKPQRLLVSGDEEEVAQHVADVARWITFTNRRALVLRARGGQPASLSSLLEPLASAPELAAASPSDLAELSAVVPAVTTRFATLPPRAEGAPAAAALARAIDTVADEVPVALIYEKLEALPPDSRELILQAATLLTGPVLVILTAAPESLPRANLLTAFTHVASPTATSAVRHAPTSALRRRTLGWAAAAGLALVAGAAWWAYRSNPGADRVVAVGIIETVGTADSVAAIRAVLARNLERIPGLRVLSEARVREFLGYSGPGSSAAHLSRAAAKAGATEMIEGVVTQRPGSVLRFDLRRVRLEDGETRAAFAVESRDALDLVDLAAERIAADLGLSLPTPRTGGTSASLVAYRMYEEGLRAYYVGELDGARRLFRAALAQDSSFAMAAYYLSRTVYTPESWNLLKYAMDVSRQSPERERLLIRMAYAVNMQDPGQIVIAESLSTRYPLEPDARLAHADALIEAGKFSEALPHLRAVLTYDSLSLTAQGVRCRACDALGQMTSVYYRADSVQAFERTARLWTRLQPRSADSWMALARSLGGQDRHEEALAALRTAAQFNPATARHPAILTDVWIRAGDFEKVDRAWQDLFRTGNAEDQAGALFGMAVSFRIQGRFREALAAADRLHERSNRRPGQRSAYSLLGGLILYDMKQYRASAAAFDSMAKSTFSDVASRDARHRAWNLTHAATGYAAAGDTLKLRILEDSIRRVGARSAYRRDQLLHHYVRGLRLKARNRHREAAEAFRLSLYSPTEGHLRANLELARALLASGQPREAIPVLRSALRGPIGASGLYATRTELQELLAQAYMATGKPDSAELNLERVANAWKRADPQLRDRVEHARRMLAALKPRDTVGRVAARPQNGSD